MDKKIAEYLQKQRTPQKEICHKLRKMILKNFPSIEETAMTEGLWYEGKFYITSFGDHVNLGFGIDGLNKRELKHFEGTGKFMRHIKFFSQEDINEEKLLTLMQMVYKKTNCTCNIKWRSQSFNNTRKWKSIRMSGNAVE